MQKYSSVILGVFRGRPSVVRSHRQRNLVKSDVDRQKQLKKIHPTYYKWTKLFGKGIIMALPRHVGMGTFY